jgi:hypothetical protein
LEEQIAVFSNDSRGGQDSSPPLAGATTDGQEIQLLLSGNWNKPLWRRLLEDFRDTFAPEKLPPLHLTSRPMNIGMLASDRLNMPWFRTIFTNVGDVISPENLPPLELESNPVDTGELISDQMSHLWISSLLRNLADRVSPERLPALQLTSKPMEVNAGSDFLQLPSWSATISTPKVFLPDVPKPSYSFSLGPPSNSQPKPDPAQVEFIHALEADLRRDLRRSVFRKRLWVSLAIIEVAVGIGSMFFWK